MASLTVTEREVTKSAKEKIIVRPWCNDGQALVSVGLQRLSEDGDYYFIKGGFALSAAAARELATALVEVAKDVETAN
ncbi:MAG: hypothetical protein M1274_15350 [Actinobacteria bacterium]|nr:hypothetical protein [Actinomycetota bacterium]